MADTDNVGFDALAQEAIDTQTESIGEALGKVRGLVNQFAEFQAQARELLGFLTSKDTVRDSRLHLINRAIHNFTDAYRAYGKGLSRIAGVAGLEGHGKTFKLVKRAEPPKKKPGSSKKKRKSGKQAALRRSQQQQQGRPDLFSLLPDVIRDNLLPLLTPSDTCSLGASAASVGSSQVGAAVASGIDKCIRTENLGDVLSYSTIRESTSARRFSQMVRLHYAMEKGGCWRRSGHMIRVAKHHGWVRSLPIELTPASLERAGTKTEIDRRSPMSAVQLMLFTDRLTRNGANVELDQNPVYHGLGGQVFGGEYRIGGRTVQDLTSRVTGSLLSNGDAVPDSGEKLLECKGSGYYYQSLHDPIFCRVQSDWGHKVASTGEIYPRETARFKRVEKLSQSGPLYSNAWSTRSSWHSVVRHLTLYGHEKDDEFTVHLRITAIKEGHVEVSLCTTEPAPHTRAIAKAYEKMGEEEVMLIFGKEGIVAVE
ncbi:unnamed protein product [Vitrella brassicaformis CCMP3155]|uniref:Uncharacterized protein n=1 Tax=Vitrella brassicaformis (strain CCMP3155) TaxID=1169540 RepID=A0A0G4EC45_VITBC|nr:unnamed protein product [Vitrella brassicaformis CCMP3155]|eukprot:CEL92901.1 unnamed protein product [Vitrella brassicaformis CCMP3155]